MNQQNSSASPTKQVAKRRHTAAFASEGNASPEKGLKRTKTLKTYGASRRQAEPTDDGNFDHFRKDEGRAAPTSQSVRFSEHSGHQSSMPLPPGSLKTDFLNHEPAVMFKDTGDTVADASSEQQRLLDQILASNKGLSTSLTKVAQQALEHQSSSIPWTASDIADSAKSRKSQATTKARNEASGDTDELADDHDLPKNTDLGEAKKAAATENDETQAEASQSRLMTEQAQSTSRKPKSSPRVEISRQESKEAAAEDEGAKPTQRVSKGRNRKVQEESSEPLNSDDRAIGLPQERYQPRPSRRRATQVVEEPIDYSVVPEKAAKVKRTKTTGAKTSVATSKDEPDASQGVKPGVSPPGLSIDGRSGDDRKGPECASKSMEQTPDVEEDDSPVKRRRTIKQHGNEPTVSGTQAEEQSASSDKSTAEAQEGEDKIFVEPAIPVPKPKSSSKAKRAQTTIFEDHVDFGGSGRSPNLSQQQAKRKSALQDVQNVAAPKTQRKRKSVVADDSDDEDELAKENDAVREKAQSPPKKRRGRPPKSNKQAQPKASDFVLQDSDEDEEHVEQDEAEQSEAEEPPKKKRGRGRPAKAASKAQPEDVIEEADGKAFNDEPAKTPEKANEGPEEPGAPTALTPSKPSAPAAEIPTPSPEKPTEKAKSTPQKAASSAAQHSPIKSSTKVPLRVGLSKRHRIPPLLRIAKPAKR